MRKKDDNLINKCCSLLDLELSEFCDKYDLKESTLKGWRKVLPNYGKVMIEEIMKNYHLEKELEIKTKKLSRLQSLLSEG